MSDAEQPLNRSGPPEAAAYEGLSNRQIIDSLTVRQYKHVRAGVADQLRRARGASLAANEVDHIHAEFLMDSGIVDVKKILETFKA